jgi:hypothetical protein
MSPDEDKPVERFPELTPFEAALSALTPRAAGMDRETLFFQAGQAAALRDLNRRRSLLSRWAWPGAFSAMTAVAATLLVMLTLRTGPMPSTSRVPDTIAEQLSPLAAPDPQADDRSQDMVAYSRLRERVLRQGVDALPAERIVATGGPVAASVPQEYRKLLHEALQD